MAAKPTYDELEQKVKELENEVSKQKQVENALKASEEKFFKAFRSAPLLMTITSIEDGCYLEVNDAFVRITGYSRETAIGKTPIGIGLVDPNDRERLPNLLKPDGRIKELEIQITREDGSELVCLYSGEIIEFEGKRCLLSIANDITERKNAEEALRESEDRYRGVVEDMPLLICNFLPDGKITFVNKSYCKYFGRSFEKLIESNFLQLVPESEQKAVMENIRGLTVEIPNQSHEHQVVAPGGEIRWQKWTNRALFDEQGQAISYQSIGEDITEQKQAEEELREREDYLSAIFETTRDGFWLLDTQGRITDVNEAYCRMSGYSRDELLQLRIPDLEVDETPDETAARINRIIKNGSELFETRHRRKDGSIFDVELSVTWQDRDIPQFICFCRDITDRKQIVEALRESEETVKKKLQAILEPEGDISALHLADIIDHHEVQSMMEKFYGLTKIGGAIVDVSGKILASVGWQDICAKFHRTHPETLKNCMESDTILSSGVLAGNFKPYRCKNNMWDMVTPIELGGRHLGNIFIGQFFYEDEIPDYELFRNQGRQYGFDEAEYLAALDRVPRWSRETVDAAMVFYAEIAGLISSLSYSKIKLSRSLSQQETVLRQLAESEETHRTLVECLPDIVMRFDRDARHLFVSENVKEVVDFQSSQFIGKTHRDLGFSEEQCRFWEESIQKVFDTGLPLETEFNFKSRQGFVTHNWQLRPELDAGGTIRSVLSLSRDITEHRKAEQNYQTLFREMLDGFALHEMICDTEGKPVDYRFLAVNPAFERMTGLKAEHVVGKRVFEVLPNTEQHWIETYGRVARTGEPVFFENHSEELNKYFEVRAFRPLPNHFACIFADITDRKIAEQEHEKLSAQLLQAQKMESIGRLAGGVAHDFNNKLGVILGFAQMILTDMEPENPIYKDLEAVQDAAKGAGDLTRQLLAFARKQTIAPRELDVNETIAGMLKMLMRLIGEDIDLTWQPDTNLWPVKMDPAQIDQILANLAVNARDSIDGVGKVTIETKNRVLDNAYCAEHDGAVPGEFIMLAVTDNGCGMERTILDQIFEPFFTTKGVGKGTGLGLSTVYGIVKQNDGFVSVYSEPEKGTTFKIYIPRYQGDTSLKTVTSSGEVPRGDGETILLVEDDPGILRISRIMLERLGYAVLTANSPHEAMEIIGEHADGIHLLMTDVVMPQMDGKDLAKHVMKILPETKILFMSGYTANAIAHHGILDEGVNFIEKPFMSDSLARKVREVLDEE